MKKAITILLAIVLVLSLAACGGGSATTNTPAATETPETPAPTTEPTPEPTPEPVDQVISENNEQEISESDLFGDWFLMSTSESITINSDGSLIYYKNGFENYGEWSIADGKVHISNVLNGDWAPSNEEGTICLTKDSEKIVRWESLPWLPLAIRNTADDGVVNVVLDQYRFTETIERPEGMDDIWYNILSSDVERNPLGNNMIYLKLDYTVTNMGRSELLVGDIDRKGDWFLDYNDGFIYSTRDNSGAYFISGNDYTYVKPLAADGNAIPIQPLETKKITTYIKCPALIMSASESLLKINFVSQYSNKTQYFSYCDLLEDTSSRTEVTFSIRNGVQFGDTIEQVSGKEERLDFDDKPLDGYLSAQVRNVREYVEFEGFDHAFLFYYFDEETETLREISAFWAETSSDIPLEDLRESLLESLNERYGVPISEADKHTYTLNHRTETDGKNSVFNLAQWRVPDGSRQILIELFNCVRYDTQYLFVGMSEIET